MKKKIELVFSIAESPQTIFNRFVKCVSCACSCSLRVKHQKRTFLRCIFNDWNYKRICTANKELERKARGRVDKTILKFLFSFNVEPKRRFDFFIFKIKYKTKRILINSNPSPSIKIAIYEMQATNNNSNNDDDDDDDGDEGAKEVNTAATHAEGFAFLA